MIRRALVLAFILASVSLAPTAQTLKLAVAVQHTGSDTVGVRFAYRLRESIRGSRRFFLVADDQTAVATIHLLTMEDEACVSAGNGSLVGVIYLNHQAQYMMGGLHSVGAARVEEAVEKALADLDAHSRAFR